MFGLGAIAATDPTIKNGVGLMRYPRRRDIAPTGELAGLPARESPKPAAFAEPPQGMTYTAKITEMSSVLFIPDDVIFIA
jgi:hypothetical protein